MTSPDGAQSASHSPGGYAQGTVSLGCSDEG